MDFLPILSTLKRHKTAAALITLEIALSCAIVANALFVIGERLDRMNQPSGIAESELVQVALSGIAEARTEASAREDLAVLGAIPDVRSVAATNQVPYGTNSWNLSVSLEPDQMQPNLPFIATYYGSEDLIETLGLRLIAGRDFDDDEYQVYGPLLERGREGSVPSAIITADVAERLFPDGDAIGQSVYVWGDYPTRIVGVVEHLQRSGSYFAQGSRYHSILLPVTAPTQYGSTYLLRVDRERRDEILATAVDALLEVDPNRIVSEGEGTTTIERLRHDFFQQDRAMAWLLVAVCIALLAVTAAGIVGLASFWVQQRTRQIGIRRAVGATRGQILRYFQTENFLLATIGIVLGMVLAYGINGLLMERYELARLPWQFLPIGAVTVWLLGQLAVLGPALRAAAVPPAVATRSV